MRAIEPEPSHETKNSDSTTSGQGRVPRGRIWGYVSVAMVLVLIVTVVVSKQLASNGRLATHQGTSRQPAQLPATPTPTPLVDPSSSNHEVYMTVVAGVIYAGTSDNMLYALRASDGHLLWRFHTDGAISNEPVVDSGVVYVNANIDNAGGNLYALRTSDGRLLWHYSAKENLAIPAATNGVVYLSTQSGAVSSRSSSDGSELWRYTVKDSAGGTSLSLVNGIVYVTTSGYAGAVDALRAGDGSLVWHYPVRGYASPPVIVAGIAYISGQDQVAENSFLAALRNSDGKVQWQHTIDATMINAPVIANGVAYFTATKILLETPTPRAASPGTVSGDLLMGLGSLLPGKAAVPQKAGKSAIYALALSDGSERWHFPLNSGGEGWASWLFLDDAGVLYTCVNAQQNQGLIYALQSESGRVLWQHTMSAIIGNGLMQKGVIYTTTSDATSTESTIRALRTSDGSQVWQKAMSGMMTQEPWLDGDRLYIGVGDSTNGFAYAFNTADGALRWRYQVASGQ